MEITDPVSSILIHKALPDIWHVSPERTVFEAITLMSEKNVGALLVMTGEELVGIVSERDYTRKVILKGRSSKETLVREIMTDDVIVIEPGASVAAALALMTARRIRHLPVMIGNRVEGVISIGDLVKRIISAQEALIEQLENYCSGSYPA